EVRAGPAGAGGRPRLPPLESGKAPAFGGLHRKGWLMSSLATSSILFACIFGGALLGMFLRRRLPEPHLSPESKEVVKVGTGLIGTMAALVLGVVGALAKRCFRPQKSEPAQMSAKVVFLDRVLARYGRETKEIRESVRGAVAEALARIWPEKGTGPVRVEATAESEAIFDMVQNLAPKNETQRSLQAQALKLTTDIAQTRWLMFAQRSSSIPFVFLLVLMFWLAIIFTGFSLFAPANATVVITLLVCALSVSGAIFLILELDRPFEGLIQISSAPLRAALEQL